MLKVEVGILNDTFTSMELHLGFAELPDACGCAINMAVGQGYAALLVVTKLSNFHQI